MALPRSLRGLPREVGVLAAIAFCVALGFGILIPALPVFARTFDVSIFQASMVISAFALVRLVTAPLAGSLVNRLGERWVLSSGLLIVAVSSAAAGLSQNFVQLLVLRGVGGLGSTMFSVSAMALLLRVVDEGNRARATSAYQGGFLIGGVAGPAVGGLVIAWSVRAPFFVYAITLLAATAVALVFLRAPASDFSSTDQAAGPTPPAGGRGARLEELRDALRLPAYRAALVAAEADLAAREAALVQARGTVAASRAEAVASRDRAHSAARLAADEAERQRGLAARGVASEAALERAEAAQRCLSVLEGAQARAEQKKQRQRQQQRQERQQQQEDGRRPAAT